MIGGKMDKKFKSKVDGKEYAVEVGDDLENGFVEINGKLLSGEDITNEPPYLGQEVMDKGELVYSIPEIYDLYYYKGTFYDFYWDTASGCIFSKLILTQ